MPIGLLVIMALLLAVFSRLIDYRERGLVNLFGIESPGLTSCLALAERVVLAVRGV